MLPYRSADEIGKLIAAGIANLNAFLIQPLKNAFPVGEGQLIFTKLYEVFFVELKVALFAGFCLSFPIIANQLWAFVAPGLYAREKRAFLPFLLATPILFGMGAALAYYVVMPTAFRWFLGFEGTAGGMEIQALPTANEYLGLVMQFILAFGMSFLLPVLLLLLSSDLEQAVNITIKLKTNTIRNNLISPL